MLTRCLLCLALTAATLITTQHALAIDRVNVEYSADQIIESEEGATQSRIYSTPTKERRDMSQGGAVMTMITRYDKHVSWTVMPEEKMYMEAPANTHAPNKSDLSGYQIEQTALGEETVNGVVMNKSKIIMTGNDGTKMGGFMWTTKEGILAKIDALAVEKGQKARFKMEQTNIKVTKQPAELFEIPQGFEKLDMGGMGMDMLKGMMGR
ncbi:MAG: conserved exported protein of unknown function [Nitrospira sp.]|nr:MAG: conserved exported protein of unknown function [Nitrospira sp.]